MTTPSARPLLVLTIVIAMMGWIVPGCGGRTALLAREAQEFPATDAAVSTATPTDGATSQPTTNGACPDGFTACGSGAATRCYDLTRSADHCGECGNACAPGIACQSSQCRQYRCKGALSFKALPAVSTVPTDEFWKASASYQPALGDFDRDGILDFVGQTGPLAPMGLLLGRGDGTFQPYPVAPTYTHAWTAAAADLNGDGWLDLATIASGEALPAQGEAVVTVRLGNGDPTTRFDPAAVYPTPSAPSGLLLADLDHDGHVDLVVATEKRLTIWRGTTSGKLVEPTDISVGAAGSFLVAADWNRDGALDLLFGTSTLRILLGRGDGTFDKEIACGLALVTPASSYALGTAIADFDHDQKMDLLVSSTGVLLGMNGCNFATLVSLSNWADTPTHGHGPDPAGVADLDGDGNADIVTSSVLSPGDEKIGVCLGNGQGGFAAPIVVPGTESSYDGFYLMGDLNSDGKLDIIVTWQDAWQVLLNTCL